MGWSFNSEEPIYLQIVQEIKMRIITGIYQPGIQLPTVRQLADESTVNPNTVQRAMSQLEEEGLVYAQATTGRFLVDDPQLPKKLLHTLATQRIKKFLATMDALSLTREETIQLITEISKEEPV